MNNRSRMKALLVASTCVLGLTSAQQARAEVVSCDSRASCGTRIGQLRITAETIPNLQLLFDVLRRYTTLDPVSFSILLPDDSDAFVNGEIHTGQSLPGGSGGEIFIVASRQQGDIRVFADGRTVEVISQQRSAGGPGVGGSPHGFCPRDVEGSEPCEGQSPIVFDLGRPGFALTSVKEGVDFDIDGDGVPERTAWTSRDSDDAFLALDRNGNGTIDGGRELFGNVTVLANGKTGAHGYIALGELDLVANGGNGNGYVDYADRDFATLLLWTDRDHDGRSSSSELTHLIDHDIFAIALDADESNVIDEYGNRLAYVSPAYAWRHSRIQRIRTTDIFFQYRELAGRR